ncbi:MAG: hypothetical protein PHG64_06860 [Paludibacter sp.]|nr:hypothetical protein [Paludibacter sp.]
MKTKALLFLIAIVMCTGLSAATITVTTNAASGDGSLVAAITAANDNDSIIFNFDAENNEILLTDVIAMKSIAINGINLANNSKVIIKQTTAAKNFFNLATGVTGRFYNLIFDGSAGATKICITAPNGSTILINNCVFRNINSGTDNGGAGRLQGVIRIYNSLFENNTCDGTYGGGALCIYNAADAIISKCTFVGNSSTKGGNAGGGAIVARGTVANPCNVSITNSTFANNTSASRGGALMSSVQTTSGTTYQANVTAINCTFTGNKGDGAVAAYTKYKGTSKLNLVNCLVTNNIDAAGTSYSDLIENVGTDPEGAVETNVNNVIYSTASETIDTTGKNCIQVADPATANIFKSLETFATDKKRPVLTDTMGQKIAEISSSSIAKNAGVATLSGYTIPTDDQLGADRPTTPAVGAVEYIMSTSVPNADNNSLKILIRDKTVSFNGLSGESILSVYGLTGNLIHQSLVRNNEEVSLDQIKDNLVIVRIQNKNFKIFLK